MRGVLQKRKKQMGLEKRMNRLLFSTMIPMACLLVILLLIFWQYAGQYNKLSENLAVSSKFNLSFKDELDLEMYYLAIGSKEASELDDVLGQVEDAQNIMEKLRQNTYHASGVKCLNSLDAYLDNLKKRMVQLMEIKEYDRRMEFMDSNIRIITGLIMQEMQNYIYNESMYLVQVETSLTHRVKILISGMAVLLLATLGILMRRSFRLTGGIIQPVTEMRDKVKKVGKGNFDVLPVSAEIIEIEELDQGINKMAHRISGLLENVRQEKEMQHLTELQLIQAQVNPHFLYNTLDTIVWLIEGGMTDDAVEMISSLSIFFRTSLSKGNDIIPLSEEKRHTLSYLEIQQFRYRDILEFELSIPKELEENTRACVDEIRKILSRQDGRREWFLAVGQSVDRLSQIQKSYHTASRAFSQRYLYDENILYYDEMETMEHPGGQAETEDNAYLQKVDVNALNPAILQKFLSNGLQEETENFVKDYFYAIGQEPMESLVFRNYVILNVRFSVISFIKGLGCDTNEMESADTEEVLAESGKNMESAIAYAKKMISQAIEIRDQNSGNKNRSILKTAVDFIDSHYMDEEISLNTVANVANVSSNHFSALFSQNMGQTFIEYLTTLRMNKAKELLRCTGMRSSEIAGEIGYKDAHYFSYLFKKTQGMTPSDYRKAREEKA